MNTKRSLCVGLGLAALTGCGPTAGPGDTAGGTSCTSGSATNAGPVTSAGPGGTTESAGDDGSSSGSNDDGPICVVQGDGVAFCDLVAPECDVFDQDCPPGDKCVPTGIGECVPVVPAPAHPGEPCTKEAYQGPDDCDATSLCWTAELGGTEGVCVEMCQGSWLSPTCAQDGHACGEYWRGGVYPLCRPSCDPLLIDACGDGEACELSTIADTFVCAPAGMATRGPGEECSVNGSSAELCTAGLHCFEDFECLSVCDANVMDACPFGECVPVFEHDPVPPGLEDVGVCPT